MRLQNLSGPACMLICILVARYMVPRTFVFESLEGVKTLDVDIRVFVGSTTLGCRALLVQSTMMWT